MVGGWRRYVVVGMSDVRFVVELASEADREEAVAGAAALFATQSAPLPRLSRVFADSGGDHGLERFYELSVRLRSAALPRAAFDLAYRLEAALNESGLDSVKVRPDLASTIYARPATPGLAAAAAVPLAESEEKHWSLRSMRCPEAWAVPPATGGAAKGLGVVVGHPDTGYHEHPELGVPPLDLSRDYDFVDGDTDAYDPLDRFELPPGHGTRTAATIAGGESGEISGAAPGATLIPYRATRSVALVRAGGVAKAVNRARVAGCEVVSMSLGGYLLTGDLEAAINAAVAEDVIVMAAAGNWDWSPISLPWHPIVFPAAYRNCIAVGASNAVDEPWRYTGQGKKVLISAPGEDVWAPMLTQPPSVGQSSGTSYAVANVAGIAALWLSHWGGRDQVAPQCRPMTVQDTFATILRTTARTPSGWDVDRHGAGIANAQAALQAGLPHVPAAMPRAAAASQPLLTSRERLAAILPEGDIQPTIANLLHTDDPEAAIDHFGDELGYLITEHPGFYPSFAGPTLTHTPAAQDIAAVRLLLLSVASPQLAAAAAPGV
jgi:hypothetical protein